jgi:phosphate regulon transcriptional regulator PhoB
MSISDVVFDKNIFFTQSGFTDVSGDVLTMVFHKKKYRILVVDDEADIVELLTYNLTKEGYLIDSASDGETALSKIRDKKYDLLILDLMLPGIQGLEICHILRNKPETARLPIIMLTAKGEEVDKIVGLEMGADDYITKPFSTRELVARVKTVLRRVIDKPVTEKVIRIGELEIDNERCSVFMRGQAVHLRAKEFKLLSFLSAHKGKVFNREQLFNEIWRDEAFVGLRTIDVHIRRLRECLEINPDNPRYIKTMRGIGYYINEN